MKLILAAFTTVALLLTACSDDPVTPANSDKYVVNSTGSYYLSDVESVDNNPADTANPTYAPMGYDSAYVVTSVLLGNPGRTGVMLRGILKNGAVITIDTNYFSQDGEFTYQYYTLGVNDIPGVPPIMVGKAWVRIADNSSASWKALDTLIPNVSFTYNSLPITANVDVDMEGTTVGTETITIGGTTHTAKHFRVTGKIFLDHAAAKITAFTREDFWFVKDVGMVKYERGVTTLDGGMLFTPIKISGKRKTVTKFEVF